VRRFSLVMGLGNEILDRGQAALPEASWASGKAKTI
jgi:hypothetical protein